MDWFQQLQLGRIDAQARPVDMSEVSKFLPLLSSLSLPLFRLTDYLPAPLQFEACRFNAGRLPVPRRYLAPFAVTRTDLALIEMGVTSDNGYLSMNEYQRGFWDAETLHITHKLANNISLALVSRQHRMTPVDVVVRIAQLTEKRIKERRLTISPCPTTGGEVRNWMLGSMVWEICEGVFPEVVAARYAFSVRDMASCIAQWGLAMNGLSIEWRMRGSNGIGQGGLVQYNDMFFPGSGWCASCLR